MNLLSKTFKLVESSIDKLTFVLFSAMTAIVFIQVVSRYIFGNAIFWAEEFARYAMIWIAFLGTAMGIKEDAHTKIEFFVNLLPKSLQKIVNIINCILMISFIGVISYYAIEMMQFTLKTLTPSLQIPLGFVQMILPISGALMIVYLIGQMFKSPNQDGNDELISLETGFNNNLEDPLLHSPKEKISQ